MGCKVIKLGSDATAIMCGGKSDHECDEKDSVLLLSNGERVSDTPENWEKYNKDVIGGSVCCSVCGRAAIDNAAWL